MVHRLRNRVIVISVSVFTTTIQSSPCPEMMHLHGHLHGFLPPPHSPPPVFDDPTTLPTWLVQGPTSEVMELTAAQVAGLDMHCPLAHAEIVARLLSAKGLPATLINIIFDMLNVCSEDAVETRETMQGSAPLDLEYLRFVVPPPPADTSLLEATASTLVFECVSCDQGWATYQSEYNNTYQDCYSWVEYEITDAAWQVVVPRQSMCYNLRASPSFRRHRRHVAMDHHVLPGHQVTLFLRALSPGWENRARYGRIALRRSYRLVESSH
ncbi:Aste57867_9343 [Aphanomyces stellatus]|uniref:Aste57867_9343 protein n=1 Tax=Aphanomyces stellatus TaxID=120398 RepID=A0A485KMY9_9STRA|nr:hypothetical protein As57867_009307 [Aphanomyces stellatus]VFT86224.1 Aste57867_9343 [Aphanomyces stellatus]